MKSAYKTAICVCILAILFVCSLGISQAAVMPVYERLNPITASLDAPTAVAIDNYGCIFVAESINNRLLIYTQGGQYYQTLSGLQKPVSVAVDGNGKIYIGNKNTGNVEVYSAGLSLLSKLGTGDGEFTQPGAIAVHSTGKVYVVDSAEDVIKVYNSDGTADFTFGSSGSGDGEFNFPTSVAIDEVNGELIISDLQLIPDVWGAFIEGARVQVFDMSGVYKRNIGEYGVGDGKLAKPMGVAVDGLSRIYITDTVQHALHVFDNSGTFLGVVYDAVNPIRTPLGIAIGSTNKVYIASLTAAKIDVYGITPYTQMEVSPLSLSFEGQVSNPPADLGVQISNNGTAELNWSATTGESWITLSAASGSINASEAFTLNVGVNMDGLSSDTYTGSVSIDSGTGSIEVVSVELTVLPTPELSVSPAALQYTSTNGSAPASQILTIANIGEGTLNWTAASDSGWITTSKNSGTAPDSMTVNVNISSKALGTYTGAITVTGESALSSPLAIPVTLNIIELTGSINVTTNIAEATFIVNGPVSFNGSGTGWSAANALTGSYSIVFGDVQGYTTPSSQNLTLQENSVITFTGDYVSDTPEEPASNNKNIIVGAGPGVENTGIVKIFKSDGTDTGIEFLAHSYNYGVNVAAGDINGDGVDEIITAPGQGPDNPAEINIFDKDGNKLTNLSITGNSYNYGATVASGDFNGDGYYEVVVGAGAGADNPAEVKIYVYDVAGDRLVDSGINLLAYDTGYGVMVAAGDFDGDGEYELITAPGPGDINDGLVRVWEVDTSLGAGHWSTEKVKEITVDARYEYSVSISSGDVNGDGYAEVITGAGPHLRARDEIKVFNWNGDMTSEFKAYIVSGYGATVASGDIDDDGVADIVVGAGPGSRNRAIVKVFDVNGVEQARFKALSTTYGVNISIGYLGHNE